MDNFLNSVARRILADHPTDADRALVVFNNHRSALFLSHAFERISATEGRTFFLPRTTTIDELVASLTGLKIVPNEFLLFELYRLHEEIGGPERKYRTFDEFIAFGDLMLADFSEIDRYCVDAHDLFVGLHGRKALDAWDIENPNMSSLQQDYLDFYHSLHDYYSGLRHRLEERGEAYGGMAYRHAAEQIDELASRVESATIYFVGFNAMSECERKIIGEYCRRGIGVLLTDSDVYYYDDPTQEAGLFLRRHSDEFPTLKPEGPSNFATHSKEIYIVECPEAVLQCKYAGQVLESHADWLADSESTAIVLADESLIIPTLGTLPQTEADYGVNISMGFAYADSAMHQTAGRIVDLFRHARADGYYHTTITDLLADRHIAALLPHGDYRSRAARHIERENRIRLSAADIATITGTDRLAFLFPAVPPDVNGVIAIMHQLATELVAAEVTERDKKEKQALAALAEIVAYLEQLQSEYHYIEDINTLAKIYDRLAARHQIAFLGQPLSGLQILGVLETRNLDFRRVIVLSVNEGVIPSGNKANTLIPYELQRVFHLPTYEEKDAVFAYNFYRLLQRADEIHLCYSTEAGNLGKRGEESRFLKQVRDELAVRMPQSVRIHELVVAPDASRHSRPIEPIGHKTEHVMQRLHELAQRGFSPSSLSNYVDCPLKYYYLNVLGIDTPTTAEEDLDSSQMGTCVHNILQRIYTPYIGREVEAKGLREAIGALPELMHDAFAEFYSHGRSTEGRNHFLYSVGESQLRHMLQHELDELQAGRRIQIVALEQEMRIDMGEGAVLKGFVDRIDRYDGMLRIVDYKTGRLKDDDIAISTEHLDAGILPGKWLQLMCYTLLYVRTAMPSTEGCLQAGIYPLQHTGSGVRLASWDGDTKIVPQQLSLFETRIGEMIADILNPELPFVAAEAPKGCAYCPAAGFCAAAVVQRY